MIGTDFATLLSTHLNSHLATVLILGPFFHYCQVFVFHRILSVGNERYSESLSTNIPNGLLPSLGAKEIILSPVSVISGSCSNVSVTPEGHLST